MHKVLIAGAGKIGAAIACILSCSNDYTVYLADLDFQGEDVARLLALIPSIQHEKLDVRNLSATKTFLEQHGIVAVLSSLPFFLNSTIATAAREAQCHYFDLTEDLRVRCVVSKLAHGAGKAFVPQCGLAPGIVNIIAHSLIQSFDECYKAFLRVGALPQATHNPFHYSLTWSTDGLINEYDNPCEALLDGKEVLLNPLDDLETVHLNGEIYEAFNTSGGLGSLTRFYKGKLQQLNYKTLRYPGHCSQMQFLMQDLHLNQKKDQLKKLLEETIPKTYEDVVIIYVSAEGKHQGHLLERHYVKKIYPADIGGLRWSAIQRATALGLCAIVDLVLADEKAHQGLIGHEAFSFDAVLANHFGQIFQGS